LTLYFLLLLALQLNLFVVILAPVNDIFDLVLNPCVPTSPSSTEPENVSEETHEWEWSIQFLVGYRPISNSALSRSGMWYQAKFMIFHIMNRVVSSENVVASEPEVVPGWHHIDETDVFIIGCFHTLDDVIFRQNADPVKITSKEKYFRPHSVITGGNNDTVPNLNILLVLGELMEETICLVGAN